ncbi:MAG: hypothetical protein ACI4WW_02735 [Candidatus Coprovivens sp.]
MTSKEAFNKLQHYINGAEFNDKEYLECCQILDKDLDRLEKLGNVWASEEWCNGIPLSDSSLKHLFDYNSELFDDRYKLDIKNLELEKENQELKETIYLTYSEFGFDNLSDFRKQMRKNAVDLGKLKNVIEILKKLDDDGCLGIYDGDLLKEEREALKEVIEE